MRIAAGVLIIVVGVCFDFTAGVFFSFLGGAASAVGQAAKQLPNQDLAKQFPQQFPQFPQQFMDNALDMQLKTMEDMVKADPNNPALKAQLDQLRKHQGDFKKQAELMQGEFKKQGELMLKGQNKVVNAAVKRGGEGAESFAAIAVPYGLFLLVVGALAIAAGVVLLMGKAWILALSVGVLQIAAEGVSFFVVPSIVKGLFWWAVVPGLIAGIFVIIAALMFYPKQRSRGYEDDDDDRPRRRRPRDDEEEYERPRRRRPVDDDDYDAPPRRRFR